MQVSKGFLSGAQEPLQAVWPAITSRLLSTAGMELWFCGHSLGGACAKAALLHLAFSRAATTGRERDALTRSWVGCISLPGGCSVARSLQPQCMNGMVALITSARAVPGAPPMASSCLSSALLLALTCTGPARVC